MNNFLDGEHWRTAQLTEELQAAAAELRTLQFINQIKPTFSVDGNQCCFLYGELPNDCVVGYGDTPWKAAQEFHNNFINRKP